MEIVRKWTDYYEFNTIDGPIYCYQDKEDRGYISSLGIRDTNYSQMKEFFTGIGCNHYKVLIDLNKEMDKFNSVKKELYQIYPRLDEELYYKAVISYITLSFSGGLMKDYIIDYMNYDNPFREIYTYDNDNYRRIEETELVEKIEKLIREKGSKEAIQRDIIEKIENRRRMFQEEADIRRKNEQAQEIKRAEAEKILSKYIKR